MKEKQSKTNNNTSNDCDGK